MTENRSKPQPQPQPQPQPKSKLSPLAFQIFKKSKSITNWNEQKILVGVSGGRDSMVLLALLLELMPWMEFQLCVLHIHHGESSDQEQNDFRNKAQELVEEICKNKNIKYYVYTDSSVDFKNIVNTEQFTHNNESEAVLRELRKNAFLKIQKKSHSTMTALAHHADDLLETRLIRLIRGTGLQGLYAMGEFKSEIWRPLLNFSVEELILYQNKNKINFIEDPSNQNPKYLRNWIRHQWLKELETKRPGSKLSVARSFEQILSEISIDPESSAQEEVLNVLGNRCILDRELYKKSSSNKKKSLIRNTYNSLQIQHYTQKHVLEVLKRLDSPQKIYSFEVSRLRWSLNAKQIVITPTSV